MNVQLFKTIMQAAFDLLSMFKLKNQFFSFCDLKILVKNFHSEDNAICRRIKLFK